MLHYYTKKLDIFSSFFFFFYLKIYMYLKSGHCYRQVLYFSTSLCSGTRPCHAWPQHSPRTLSATEPTTNLGCTSLSHLGASWPSSSLPQAIPWASHPAPWESTTRPSATITQFSAQPRATHSWVEPSHCDCPVTLLEYTGAGGCPWYAN